MRPLGRGATLTGKDITLLVAGGALAVTIGIAVMANSTNDWVGICLIGFGVGMWVFTVCRRFEIKYGFLLGKTGTVLFFRA